MVAGKGDLKPKMVVDYNNTMVGVDRVDQHLAAYPVPQKREAVQEELLSSSRVGPVEFLRSVHKIWRQKNSH
ncbi:hypothetical protein ANN_17313 [Periplaneta americana]|uniref:Uncharacterized protein n=1 Tax=Periplaneta americana TaxID=6978 RepID=A0ABQ8STJ4_PERAM|nr:hypothetical protein ANN_17313 [Periplaneta americana]